MPEESIREATAVDDILQSPSSRRMFLTGAGVAAAGLGLAATPLAASAATLHKNVRATMPDSTQDILNIAATAEAAAVTALYHVHLAVNRGQLNTSGVAIPVPFLVKIVRAILRQEQDHYAFITGAGGKPALLSFTFPPDIFRSATAALRFLETADTIFTAAYMAAARDFAAGGLPKLAQYTYQIGGTEAEHRALARAALGRLPNDRSFERDLFPNHITGAVTVLTQLGVLKPGLHYPGAKAVDHILRTSGDRDVTAGVIYRGPGK